MECRLQKICTDAHQAYNTLCDGLNRAEAEKEAALDMMIPDMAAEVTEGIELSTEKRVARRIALNAAAELAQHRQAKAGLERELVAALPMFQEQACNTPCPLIALAQTFAPPEPQLK